MADLLNTIASQLPQTAGTIATIYGIAKPFLAKILGPASEEIGELGRDYIKGFRADNVAKRLAEADKKLKDANIEPETIPLKTLVPLLESASLENNEYLTDMWSTLLANAANPNRKTDVNANLVDIMRQLTYPQALILQGLGLMLENGKNASASKEIKAGTIMNTSVIKKIVLELDSEITENIFYLSLDSLSRHRLCITTGLDPLDVNIMSEKGIKEAFKNIQSFLSPGRANVSLTYLGLAFLEACDTPEAMDASENISTV